MSVTSELVREDATPADPSAGVKGDIVARSPLQLFLRRLRRDKVAMISLGFVVVLILVALLASPIHTILGTPGYEHLDKGALDSFGTATGPSSKHYFGVDDNGGDVFARTLYGTRVSLIVAFVASFIEVFIGVIVGLLAGYYRGWIDSALSRVSDVFLAFPYLLIGLGLASACSLAKGCLPANTLGRDLLIFGALLLVITLGWMVYRFRGMLGSQQASWGPPLGFVVFLLLVGAGMNLFGGSGALLQPGLAVVIFVIAFFGWPYIGRIIRGQVLSMREKEFVEASRSLGASNTRIMFREILPNLVAPIIVYSTLLIPVNILFEASLSFLGVGVQPPKPSWGAMIADAASNFQTHPWYMLFPGVALLLTVLAFNLLGDGLQDALNPRTGK